MSKPTTLAKPKLDNKTTLEAALAFAEGDSSPKITSTKQTAAEKRAFFAPEGYRRLTINLREDLHKQLRLAAIEQDCTATEIVVRLLEKELNK
jgi:hypothetical protein